MPTAPTRAIGIFVALCATALAADLVCLKTNCRATPPQKARSGGRCSGWRAHLAVLKNGPNFGKSCSTSVCSRYPENSFTKSNSTSSTSCCFKFNNGGKTNNPNGRRQKSRYKKRSGVSHRGPRLVGIFQKSDPCNARPRRSGKSRLGKWDCSMTLPTQE